MFSPGTESIVSTQLCAAWFTRMFSWTNRSKKDVYSPALLTRPWSSIALLRWRSLTPLREGATRFIWEAAVLFGLETQSRPSQLRLSTYSASTITQKSGRCSESESAVHLSGVINFDLDWDRLHCILLDPVWFTIGWMQALLSGQHKNSN